MSYFQNIKTIKHSDVLLKGGGMRKSKWVSFADTCRLKRFLDAGRLAQLVEQLPFKEKAEGSNPSTPTRNKKRGNPFFMLRTSRRGMCTFLFWVFLSKEDEMKKILWVSKHSPFPSQLFRLECLFGTDYEIERYSVEGSRAVKRYFDENGFDDIVCAVPKQKLFYYYLEGLRPLWPVLTRSRQGYDRDPDLVLGPGRKFWFRDFFRVDRIGPVYEDIVPRKVGSILRATRHFMCNSERANLERLFGSDVDIYNYSHRFSRIEPVLEKMYEIGASELVFVGRLSQIQRVLDAGVRPIRAITEDGFFIRHRRIVEVSFEILPVTTGQFED